MQEPMRNSERPGTQDLGIAVKILWIKKWNECGVNVNPVVASIQVRRADLIPCRSDGVDVDTQLKESFTHNFGCSLMRIQKENGTCMLCLLTEDFCFRHDLIACFNQSIKLNTHRLA